MTIGLQWCDGFDVWSGLVQMGNISSVGRIIWGVANCQTSATGNASGVILGSTHTRSGRGQAVALSYPVPGVVADCILTAAFLTGATSTIPDGGDFYFGFNACIGITGISGLIYNTGTPAGSGQYLRMFGISNQSPGAITGGLTSHKITFWYDVGNNSFICTVGTGTPPGGTGVPLVAKASGQPTRNPLGQWTYFEGHLYRSSTSGLVDLWIENSGGTLDHLLAATALDTSVATLGNLSKVFLGCGYYNSTTWITCAYDDFWLALSGSPGVPCYVTTVVPSAEVSESGTQTWFPSVSTGTNVDMVDNAPWGFITTTGNTYTYFSIGQTGAIGNTNSILFSQSAMPYTPATIFAVQAVTILAKTQGSGGTAVGKCRTRYGGTGGTDSDSPAHTLPYVSGPTTQSGNSPVQSWLFSCVPHEVDPATSLPWTAANGANLLIGAAGSGSTTVTGAGTAVVGVFGVYAYWLGSITAAASGAPGAPASGFGQPFWLICGAPNFL